VIRNDDVMASTLSLTTTANSKTRNRQQRNTLTINYRRVHSKTTSKEPREDNTSAIDAKGKEQQRRK